MQATLTFDLEIPEDRDQHMRCVKALDLVLCLGSLEAKIYKMLKRDTNTPEQEALILEMSELLSDTMKEYYIDLDLLDQ
jgi:hypothetical protein